MMAAGNLAVIVTADMDGSALDGAWERSRALAAVLRTLADNLERQPSYVAGANVGKLERTLEDGTTTVVGSWGWTP